jgi:5-methylcytosine-specific restriction endonuclease McrA
MLHFRLFPVPEIASGRFFYTGISTGLSSAYCPRPWKAGFHLDHKIARNAGGTDDANNLHWLCHSCHSRKTVKKDGGFGHPGVA